MHPETTPHNSRPDPPVAEPGPGARLLHLTLAGLGWILFAIFWFEVFTRTPPAESVRGVLALGVLLVLSVGATAIWVRHNLFLSRRLGERRRRIREIHMVWSHDVLGRPLAGPDLVSLQESPEIEIDLDPTRKGKVYRAF